MIRRRVVRAGVIVAAGGLLFALVDRVGLHTIWAQLRSLGLSLAWMCGVYLLYVAARAAALWQSALAENVRYADVFRIRLAAEGIETLSFAGPFLAEPAKGWLLTRTGMPPVEAFGAVASEFLIDTTMSAAMEATAISAMLARGLPDPALRASMIGILALMIAFLAATAYASLFGIGLIAPSLRSLGILLRLPGMRTAAMRAEPVERVLVSFLSGRSMRLARVLAIDAAAHALLVCEVWIVLSALGVSQAGVRAFLIEGSTKFVGIVFAFVPGQIGVAEGVYAIAASALSLPPAIGLTLAIARRLRGLCISALALMAIGKLRLRS